jgi:hypothetical protein
MIQERVMDNNLLHNFYIKDKKARKVLFVPKRAQIDYLQHRTGKDFILKARQIGFTTLEQLRKLKKVMLNSNITVATIAHERQKTDDIFQITKYAWDNLPEVLRESYNVKYDNIRELYFAKGSVNEGSRYYVDLDMRSGTVHDLHISEVAFVKDIDSLFASTLEAVPKGGVITLETTANGLNKAHDLWQDAVEGRNEFTPHFYNWTWDEDYWETPPENDSWREDYKVLAKKYNLISDIQEKYGLSDEQFYWYYLKARRLKELVKQEYPTIAEEAFLSSSISVFDLYKVAQLKALEPIRTFRGVNIYREPKAGNKYVIGCDTAEGVGNDRTGIEVFDLTDMKNIEEVASFQDVTIRPDQIADLLIELGNMYNEAFIIPERNSSGLTTVLKLQEKGYRKLFVNRNIDKKTQKQKNEYGWRTTGSNRDLMIDDFVEVFENGNLIINSNNIIQEMKTFVRKNNGRREHDEGYHDDSLFASFLAIQGIKYYRDSKYQSFDRGLIGL